MPRLFVVGSDGQLIYEIVYIERRRHILYNQEMSYSSMKYHWYARDDAG